MVCEMEIAESGEMTGYKFYEAVIHSHARMTYNEVSDIVEPALSDAQKSIQATIKKRHESLIEHFEDLYSLFHALRVVRDSGGAWTSIRQKRASYLAKTGKYERSFRCTVMTRIA